MERPSFPSEDALERRSALPPSPSPPAEAAERERQIEAYLDEIFAPLAGRMPTPTLAERRAEMRAHLEALIAAHRELGSEPAAAIRAALETMGDARPLGRAWGRECRRAASAPVWNETASLGSIVIAASTLFVSASLAASWSVGLERFLGHNFFELALGGPMLPLSAGFMVGRWRGRHTLGSRWGLLLIALASLGVSLTMTTADPRPPLVTVLRLLLWVMTSCATAGLGALTTSGRGPSPLSASQS